MCSISFLILNNILEDPIDEGEPKSQSAREKFMKSANSGNPTNYERSGFFSDIETTADTADHRNLRKQDFLFVGISWK